ncbi:MAG TPA: magnesium protoporphyrin IX methyltransferase, partial [Kouleothrix sp.]|nr:magnesium protoporphyrin IX methyltransferase [Kouleothrix sp.]
MTEVSDHKSRLLAYFDGLGFERWSAIYGDAEVSRIRRTIRQGHARMLALAEQWICEGAGEAGTGAQPPAPGYAPQVLDAGCG